VQCRRSGSTYEEDEFSEFDNMLDEEDTKMTGAGSAHKKVDFSEFDKTDNEDVEVEDEDFEDPPNDLNDQNSHFDNKPRPDGAAEKSRTENREKKTGGGGSGSFNMNNMDDLDAEEFEHFIGMLNKVFILVYWRLSKSTNLYRILTSVNIFEPNSRAALAIN